MIRYYGISYSTFEETEEQMKWYAHLEKTGEGQWWMICLKDQPEKILGAVGFSGIKKDHRRGDMGYWLFPEYQGNGYMLEAMQKALWFGRNHFNLHRIQLEIESENQPSLRLARALGFQYDGTLRDVEIKEGRYVSLDVYSQLPGEEKPVQSL